MIPRPEFVYMYIYIYASCGVRILYNVSIDYDAQRFALKPSCKGDIYIYIICNRPLIGPYKGYTGPYGSSMGSGFLICPIHIPGL